MTPIQLHPSVQVARLLDEKGRVIIHLTDTRSGQIFSLYEEEWIILKKFNEGLSITELQSWLQTHFEKKVLVEELTHFLTAIEKMGLLSNRSQETFLIDSTAQTGSIPPHLRPSSPRNYQQYIAWGGIVFFILAIGYLCWGLFSTTHQLPINNLPLGVQ